MLATPCKRRLKGSFMMILFPLVFIGSLFFAVFMVGALLVVGFFSFPCLAYDVYRIPYWISILLCPLIGLFIGIATLVHQFPRFLTNLSDFYLRYFRTARGYLYY